jgi:CRP-like cAMP-binding protein
VEDPVVNKRIRADNTPDPRANHLLAALDPPSYGALMRDGRVVTFKLGKRLYPKDDPVGSVFFPINCIVSVLAGANEKQLVGTATIGREGVVGASELIQDQVAMGLHITQLPGAAVRIEGPAFRKHLMNLPQLRSLVEQHQYALMKQVLHGVACSRLHGTEARVARWLLMIHDRARADTFPLTQQALANILAVRRATANVAAGAFKRAGLIQYVRGKVTVVDRAGLESAACECYTALWRSFARSGMQH